MTQPGFSEALSRIDSRSGLRRRLGHARAGGQWTLSAACLYADPELFFPDLFGAVGADRTRQAKEFCADCPVRGECLDWAVGRGEAYGVWGGTTPEERRLLRARRRSPVTPH